jgi:hypothetical protein
LRKPPKIGNVLGSCGRFLTGLGIVDVVDYVHEDEKFESLDADLSGRYASYL